LSDNIIFFLHGEFAIHEDAICTSLSASTKRWLKAQGVTFPGDNIVLRWRIPRTAQKVVLFVVGGGTPTVTTVL